MCNNETFKNMATDELEMVLYEKIDLANEMNANPSEFRAYDANETEEMIADIQKELSTRNDVSDIYLKLIAEN